MAQKPLRSIKFPGLSDVYTVPEGGSGGGSGGSVQADWSQNDAQAADFVKNRPGAYMTDPVETEIFDGILQEQAQTTMQYAPKLGDAITISVNGETIQTSVELDPDMQLYCFGNVTYAEFVGGTVENCVFFGYEGGWVQLAKGSYVSQSATVTTAQSKPVMLDAKYIPKELFQIDVSASVSGNTPSVYKVSATYEEIKAAREAGKTPVVVLNIDTYLKLVENDRSNKTYTFFGYYSSTISYTLVIAESGEHTISKNTVIDTIPYSTEIPKKANPDGHVGESKNLARADHRHPETQSVIDFSEAITVHTTKTVQIGTLKYDKTNPTTWRGSGLDIVIGTEITMTADDGATATTQWLGYANFYMKKTPEDANPTHIVHLRYNCVNDSYIASIDHTYTNKATGVVLKYNTPNQEQSASVQHFILAPYTVAPHLLLAAPNGLHKLTVDDNGHVLVDGASVGGTDKSLGITGAAAGKIPKIKTVDASGKPTAWEAAEMPASGPTDAQVSSAVDTWLTEHPEATTTVQDGAVTPSKTSFLEREFASIMDLGEYKQTFSYSIKNDGSYYIHSWNKNYNFKADITGLTKIVIRATAAYINYVFFAEAPTGATGQTVVGHGGTFAGQTKLNETDANAPTAQTVTIDVPSNAVWLMVDFGYAQPTELMIGKPIERWKFGGQIDKTVNGADIVDKTVDTPKLADGAVTTEKLANQSVSTDKLAGYSAVCRDVPWELFLDGYGTSSQNTVESAACAVYAVKFEAGKTYCILNLPYPHNTNELVTDPTDIQYFGNYFSYYPSLPDVAANLASGKDRLYGYKKTSIIQQVLLKAESDGYVETAIPGQALSQPPVCFTVKQDWYVLRASTKPDAGKRVNNCYVSELQMTGISDLGNGMHGQSWYVYKKDLGNGFASDKGYLQQIFASKTANAENERAYAAMSRDVPRDCTLSIQFIGDSITYAASNAGLQNAFRKYVPMNLRAETMALCQSGVSATTGSGSFDWNGKQNTDTAYDAAMSGYSGLAQKLAEYKTNLSLATWADAVDIVVVELGTNDHWEQATLGSPTNLTEDTNFYGAVEKTLTLLEDTFPHAQILWMLPFKNKNWKTSTVKLVDYLIALKILCQTHTRCWVLDLFDKWFLNYDDTDLRSKFFIDDVHITGNAHKCVAESMIDKIRQIISVCGLRQIETVHATNADDSVYGSANA